jgi:hypothetical protein
LSPSFPPSPPPSPPSPPLPLLITAHNATIVSVALSWPPRYHHHRPSRRCSDCPNHGRRSLPLSPFLSFSLLLPFSLSSRAPPPPPSRLPPPPPSIATIAILHSQHAATFHPASSPSAIATLMLPLVSPQLPPLLANSLP